MRITFICALFVLFCACDAFQPIGRRLSAGSASSLQMVGPFEGIKEPVENYVGIWTPMFAQAKEMGVPDLLIHWGHGAAMGTVLLAMGGIGTFLGYQVRAGNGAGEYWFTLGKTAREQHPLIMGLMAFFFLLGGQGGLVLLATQGKPILESPHAVSALVGMGLLATQAALPLLFESKGQAARTAHATLGTATMAALFVHAFNGVNLGLSF